MKLNFKRWLNEVATTTVVVAPFQRMVMGMVRRNKEQLPHMVFNKKKRCGNCLK